MEQALRQNLALIRARIAAAAVRAARNPEEVEIVAATKTVSAEAVVAAARAGITMMGENRVQEAQAKIGAVDALRAGIEWHFIGRLQGNKARRAAQLFGMIESVDTVELARRLDRIIGDSENRGRLPVLLELNMSGEPSKAGFGQHAVAPAVQEVLELSHLQVCGLMTIGPTGGRTDAIRRAFIDLRNTRDELAREFGAAHFRIMSMGMSDDFEIAVEEGATHIRLGRVLFGARQPVQGANQRSAEPEPQP